MYEYDDTSTKKEENIIPLWGEVITINKKMVKLGEILIRKYQTTEKQKICVDIKKEKLTIKYPDNHKEEIV
jgi:stress response protein YsnF